MVASGEVAAGRRGACRGRRRGAGGDSAVAHGDARRAPDAPAPARRARPAGRVARRARPAAVRLPATLGAAARAAEEAEDVANGSSRDDARARLRDHHGVRAGARARSRCSARSTATSCAWSRSATTRASCAVAPTSSGQGNVAVIRILHEGSSQTGCGGWRPSSGPRRCGRSTSVARVVANLDDAHHAPYFSPNKATAPSRLRLVHRRLEDPHRVVQGEAGDWPRVRLPRASRAGPRTDGGSRTGVPPGRHERARLARVLAEQVLERPVDDVRRGVGARAVASQRVLRPPRRSPLAGHHLTGEDLTDVHDRVGRRRVARRGFGARPVGVRVRAGVTDLATALGVEGAVATGSGPRTSSPSSATGELAVLRVQEGLDRRLRIEPTVADELRRGGPTPHRARASFKHLGGLAGAGHAGRRAARGTGLASTERGRRRRATRP